MTTGRIHGSNDRRPSEAAVDLLAGLRARWRLLLGLTLVGAVGASAAGGFRPVVHESRAILEIGRLGTLGPVEGVTAVIEKVKLLPAQQPDGPAARATLVVSPPVGTDGSSGLVEVRARAARGEDARAAVEAATSAVLTRHAAMFEEVRRIQQAQLDRMGAAAAAIERAPGVSDPRGAGERLAAASRDDRTGQVAELSRLYHEITRLRLDLAAAESQPTRLALEPTAPVAIRPKLGLLAVLGGAIGLGLAVIATLVLPPAPDEPGRGPLQRLPAPTSTPVPSGADEPREGARARA